MDSTEALSRADELLARAAGRDPSDPDERLERNLLIAAALREVLRREPVVVGGTAEDYWTADEYHETDLDLIAWTLSPAERGTLSRLGFTQEGRHWVHGPTQVPVEFPDSTLAGDEERVRRVDMDPGEVVIIGLEDLYLDRIRQATVNSDDEQRHEFRSALAIAASNVDRIDWGYIDAVIRTEREVDPKVLRKVHRRVRRIVKERLTGDGGIR